MFIKDLFKKLITAEKKIAIILLVTQAITIHVINNLTLTINISTVTLIIEIIITL